MVDYLYEKDLRQMKYIIVTSPLHEVVVSELADHYALGRQVLRRKMIEECDMSYLENIPARYEAWKAGEGVSDTMEGELGMRLLSVVIPMLPVADMRAVESAVRARISEGVPEAEAYAEGMETIRELIRR